MLKISSLPNAVKYCEYSSPLNDGALSVLAVVGMPCVANILSSFLLPQRLWLTLIDRTHVFLV